MLIFFKSQVLQENIKRKKENKWKNLEHVPNGFCDKKKTYLSKNESEEIYKGNKSLGFVHKHLKLQNIKNHKY